MMATFTFSKDIEFSITQAADRVREVFVTVLQWT
jgi:hypothetical protein